MAANYPVLYPATNQFHRLSINLSKTLKKEVRLFGGIATRSEAMSARRKLLSFSPAVAISLKGAHEFSVLSVRSEEWKFLAAKTTVTVNMTLISYSIEFILFFDATGFYTEGLYRKSPSNVAVKKLKNEICTFG